MKLRTGRHNHRLVYVQQGTEADDADRLIVTTAPVAVVHAEDTGRLVEALNWHINRLARLDELIADSEDAPWAGVRQAAESRRVERDHLAVLLAAFGIEPAASAGESIQKENDHG